MDGAHMLNVNITVSHINLIIGGQIRERYYYSIDCAAPTRGQEELGIIQLIANHDLT